jgi:cyclomaltodextrinase
MTVDTPAWVRDAIFYQIFPDRFANSPRVLKPGTLEPWDAPPTIHGFKGGDLRGIAERLDYLEDLGITAIYLTPVFSSASNHRYHTFDYFEVDPLLGGNDALRELLDAAHGRGMRVVLDGVFNHTGRGFFPFHHILETGASSPYLRWFHIDEARLDAGQPVLAYPPPGTPATELGYKAWWGLPALPKLNTDNPEVREYLMTVAEYWLRFGIDGWRLDVPAEIADESFWQEFRRRCRAVRSDAYLVGEIWRVAPEWLRGDRFDALMNYPLGEAIIGFTGGPDLDMAVVSTHHEYRLWVRPLDGPAFAEKVVELTDAYDPDVVAVQLNMLGSHDAPRLRTVLGGDPKRALLAMVLQAALPGAPSIYYGDEIGLEGGNDPDCRRAFPWDESRWEPGLRDSVRALLRLRQGEKALRDGPLRVAGAAGPAVALERGAGDSRFIVAVNAGTETVDLEIGLEIDLDTADGDASGRSLEPIDLPGLGGGGGVAIDDGRAMLALPPCSGSVLRVR